MAPARINFGMMHAVSRWDIGFFAKAADETVDR